jgi:hypothetical protein
MPAQPHTVYANVANVKITGNELVFEFGAVFPVTGTAQAARPTEFVPEVRVVLGLSALKTFADILQKAAVQMETAAASATPQQHIESGNRPTPKQ